MIKKASKYVKICKYENMDNMTKLKEEIDNFIIILGDFTTPLPITMSSSKRKKQEMVFKM